MWKWVLTNAFREVGRAEVGWEVVTFGTAENVHGTVCKCNFMLFLLFGTIYLVLTQYPLRIAAATCR